MKKLEELTDCFVKTVEKSSGDISIFYITIPATSTFDSNNKLYGIFLATPSRVQNYYSTPLSLGNFEVKEVDDVDLIKAWPHRTKRNKNRNGDELTEPLLSQELLKRGFMLVKNSSQNRRSYQNQPIERWVKKVE